MDLLKMTKIKRSIILKSIESNFSILVNILSNFSMPMYYKCKSYIVFAFLYLNMYCKDIFIS